MKRSSVFPGLILSLAALVAVAPGCDKQGEGERCTTLNGNDDCDTGLVCQQGARTTVCCPSTLTSTTDKRCNPGTAAGGAGGSSGTAGTSAGGGGAAGSAAGSAGTAGAAGTTGGTAGAAGTTGGTAGTGGAAGTAGSGGTMSGSSSGSGGMM